MNYYMQNIHRYYFYCSSWESFLPNGISPANKSWYSFKFHLTHPQNTLIKLHKTHWLCEMYWHIPDIKLTSLEQMSMKEVRARSTFCFCFVAISAIFSRSRGRMSPGLAFISWGIKIKSLASSSPSLK